LGLTKEQAESELPSPNEYLIPKQLDLIQRAWPDQLNTKATKDTDPEKDILVNKINEQSLTIARLKFKIKQLE